MPSVRKIAVSSQCAKSRPTQNVNASHMLDDGVRETAGDRRRGARPIGLHAEDRRLRLRKGHIYSVWQGPSHLDGEYIADIADDEHLPLIGQFCDTPVRVREGDATGYGILESLISGAWPDLGLTAESDHRVSYS